MTRHASTIDLSAFLRGAEQRLLSLTWTGSALTSASGAGGLRALQRLDLSANQIERIEGLAACSQLQHLDLGHNRIASAAHVHAELGNLRSLVLCHNRLDAVPHLERLFALQALDLTANRLADDAALRLLAGLPCLEALWLRIGSDIAMSAITQHALEEHGADLAPWQLARIMRTIRMHHVRRVAPDRPVEAAETYNFLPHATVILVSGQANLLQKTRLERAAEGVVERADASILAVGGTITADPVSAPAAADARPS